MLSLLSIRKTTALVLGIFFASLMAPASAQKSLESEKTSPVTAEISHPATELLKQAAQAFAKGQGPQSLSLFIRAREEHSDLPPGEVMFAGLAFKANQTKAGRAALEKGAVSHPGDPEVWNMLGDLSFRAARVAESELLFAKALESCEGYDANPERKKQQTIQAHAGLATIYQQRQQWDAAKRHLRAWLDLDSYNTVPWQRLSVVYFRLGKEDVARETLVNLTSFAKGQLPADVTMGQLYQAAGRRAEAKTAMNTALAENGDDLATQIAIARWAMTSGEKEMLRASADRAKEIAPDSASVDAVLGMAARFEGNLTQAKSIFSDLHKKNPASFDAANGLALTLLAGRESDDYELALRHAEVLRKSYSDQRTAKGRVAAATYAWALYRNGESVLAEKVIRQAVSGGEVSPEIGYFAAEIFAAGDQLPLAQQFLQSALASPIAFPEKAAAERLQAKLQSM